VSMSERLSRLEDMFEAAVQVLGTPGTTREPEVRRALEASLGAGQPFALVILDAGLNGPGARAQLAASVEGVSAALDAGDGRTAVLLPGVGPAAAPVVADRLRVQAWTCGGARGLLPDTGVVVHPDDGDSACELLALAHERVARARVPEHDPATVTPIHRAV
jgi:hypothetical protein